MKTNLDILLKYFPYSVFCDNTYSLNKEFTIEWIENELFVVDKYYFDPEVGHVSDTDIFSGDFKQCLEFCLGHKIKAQDAKRLEKLKAG